MRVRGIRNTYGGDRGDEPSAACGTGGRTGTGSDWAKPARRRERHSDGGRRELIIRHGEETYRLRVTASNKLILTK